MKTDDGIYRQELCPPPGGCNHHHHRAVYFEEEWKVVERKEGSGSGVESSQRRRFKADKRVPYLVAVQIAVKFSHISGSEFPK